ncbi:small GTP-binding protein [Tumebacillus sp. BK434]|uniref:dynamin family protein n=1 Tax=Tumebacillus sp. BK434 TaxID=2512169 RepID=UPI0010532AE5|nr:dynamin family protein [Tumebacillus sp. BK434]TCP58216.1 small GTP-binding protein [Tumebacillus sp. BK434]
MTTLTIDQIEQVQAQAQQEEMPRALAVLRERMAATGDAKNAAKMAELSEKWEQGAFAIAFCGHFSAGKSSMINKLLGADILPSSPIPTSANIVEIKGGAEKKALAYLTDGDAIEFDLDTELEQIKNYAADGNKVVKIEITHPSELLGEHVSVMDTPGIDSTDDAHKVSTESALHLADVIFYVMDYNHVQSELNFSFTKTLKDRGKPVYLVVNQIDKHMDFELDFDEYRDSVIEGFATWGIEPDGLFFTSLMEEDHDENMFDQLQDKLRELFADKGDLLTNSVVASGLYLIEEHAKVQAANHAERKGELREFLESFGDYEQIIAEASVLELEYEAWRTAPANLEDDMKKAIGTLLDNAKITPFQTTEKAGAYIASRRPGFKVGFLFGTAKKTQDEIEQRLQALYADLKEQVQTNIDWHIRGILIKEVEQYNLHDEAYNNAVTNEFQVAFQPELLANAVKEGGLSSEEYMYQYAKDIAAEIKTLYRLEAQRFIEMGVALANSRLEADGAVHRDVIAKGQQILAAQKEIDELEQAEQGDMQALIGILSGKEA